MPTIACPECDQDVTIYMPLAGVAAWVCPCGDEGETTVEEMNAQ